MAGQSWLDSCRKDPDVKTTLPFGFWSRCQRMSGATSRSVFPLPFAATTLVGCFNATDSIDSICQRYGMMPKRLTQNSVGVMGFGGRVPVRPR